MSLELLGNSYPPEWTEAFLPEVCNPKQWKTISTSELTESGYVVYGANGKIGFYSTYTHEKPTLMITCRGATCGNLHISVPFAYINGNAMALDDLSENLITQKYLYYALKARGLDDAISGSAQPQITRQGLTVVNLRIAPLAEQQQIAQKLDELLAQVDTLKTRLDAIPKILKRFRQSVLAAAVSGRLTEEWRGSEEYNPVDLGLSKKSKKVLFPSGWRKLNLTDVCEVVSGNAFKSDDFIAVGVPAIKISNVQYGQFEIKNQEYLPAEYLDQYKKFIVSSSDLLMALTRPITNDTLKICRYPSDIPQGLLNQRVCKFNFNDEREKKFFEYLFQSDYFKSQVEDNLSETLQPNLSPTDLKRFLVVVPPLEEQTEIVRRVEQLFIYADQIEQRVKDAQARVNHLTQSILAKAFRGELTADWRALNPELISGENSAAALLERIKAEREATKPKKKAKEKRQR